MTFVPLAEAQANLPQLLHGLVRGEELIVTENGLPLARIVGETAKEERKLGTLKGTVLYMAPDFDAPLDDFKEYME
jgi:prevent-host-death family protein